MTDKLKTHFWNNQNLFSNNYLEYRLPMISLWDAQKDKAEVVFEGIKLAYGNIKDLKLGPGQEAELEDKFIRPVLKSLGFTYHVQPVSKRGFKKKRPDYALFTDSDSHIEANRHKDDSKRFFSHALTIIEAKYWAGVLTILIKTIFLTAGTLLLRQSSILKMSVTIPVARSTGPSLQMADIGDFSTKGQRHVPEIFMR